MSDVDDDGDLDIVSANGDRDRLYVNDGSGRFRDATSRLPGDDILSLGVVACDLDGDDDPDLVFANHGSDRVAWNLLRQLDTPWLLRAGHGYRLDSYARHGPTRALDVASCFVAGAVVRIPLPPLGTLRLDPTTLIPLGSVVVPAGGIGSLSLVMPNLPGVVGLPLPAQALLFRHPVDVRLTGATMDRVGR